MTTAAMLDEIHRKSLATLSLPELVSALLKAREALAVDRDRIARQLEDS